jgi:hypothetical protein
MTTLILMVVSGAVMGALMQMTRTQGSISNRTDMHAGVRSATELLQQEIGQAGRISLPAAVTLTEAVTAAEAATNGAVTKTVSSTAGMFTGIKLKIDAGPNEEVVTTTAVTSTSITAVFHNTSGHAVNAPITVSGVFASGVVPPSAAPSSFTNGSAGNRLKLYGDINDDGSMVYIEYYCDTANHKLYRNVVTNPLTAGSKPAVSDSIILLPNIQANPDGSACFSYQLPAAAVSSNWYVLNVAVTLTVQTEYPDPQTGLYQQETKALLNVSPRNVFQGWELASAGISDRIQPIPPNISTVLLP